MLFSYINWISKLNLVPKHIRLMKKHPARRAGISGKTQRNIKTNLQEIKQHGYQYEYQNPDIIQMRMPPYPPP